MAQSGIRIILNDFEWKSINEPQLINRKAYFDIISIEYKNDGVIYNYYDVP